ncbi:hypothetical protein ST201phi2-1p316 [Pseudomonas phage 201phi2-1]|uniref:Uncharacterized protein n=1 Tax=Pseudomonas phage 201phi2-1 TaxID=198110 RepID=B3FJH6_BP201|nr:hypothetical protein ST201phi2-1p316 [Pseudomonas phage 201phi2-1]ABY63296.1 hypothetical protein 201phi2-1p316 [Pseudomonas phage 201phi2-1]
MVTNRNGKVYARNRMFVSYIDQLEYLVETYGGQPVTLYYYDVKIPVEPAFFKQTFLDGVFQNVKTD